MKMQDIAIRRQPGFTLIELMVVIAILGIIAMIAIPSYQNTVRKARRTEAKTTLTLGVQQMERCFTEVSDYTNAICPTATTLGDLGNGYFNYVVASTATTFTLTAVATNQGNQNQDTQCGQLDFTNIGLRRSYDTSSGAPVLNALNPDPCW